MAELLTRRATLVAVIVLAFAGASCARAKDDSASRIVAAVRDGAERLKRSPSDTLVLSVAAPSSPGGCPEGYRVEWRADTDRLPGLGVICTTGTRGYAAIDYRAFVKVAKPLQVTKRKGEPTAIALHKWPDGTIEVVAVE